MICLPDGRYVVPGNRWDLVTAAHPRPFLSVIVPYYQGERQLAMLLEGLRLQSYPRSRFEVIVADDGSPQPLTLDACSLDVRVVRQEDLGFRAAAARNLAVRSARGQVLVFLDQDTIPTTGYLEAISRLPSLVPDALVVGRREHADLAGWTPLEVRDWINGHGPAPRELGAPEWLSRGYRDSSDLLRADSSSYQYVISAVMCCSAQLFSEIGGFDESFRHYGGEDWEFAFRAWNAGAVLAHEPAAVAWHDGPDWAGRSSPDSRRQEKEEEKRALLERIPPEDVSRGEYPANLLLSLNGPVSPRLLQALLACRLNVAVYPDGETPGRLARSRARYQATFHGEAPSDDLVALLQDAVDQLRENTVGEVRFGRLLVRSSRVLGRVARWQHALPGRDLMAELFRR
ncbi:glycosyltransferase family 2 protein [Kineosporia babensis]|uniref:Glycosyltransferase n=1 Tax=Kineosporia babensis TaxID=499548 RepID=A0A9X1NAZ1_9ACTN|nr:glycosyltransferase [Kineosporia babensis]MCD5310514.1 glycosyltransferase [Kineosporia babensis]